MQMTQFCDDKDSYNTEWVIIFIYINSISIVALKKKPSKFLWKQSVFSGQVENKYPKQDTW